VPVGAAVAPARPLFGDLAQASSQGGVIWGHLRAVALRGAILAGEPARPTLGEAEAVLQHADRLAPPGRAQKFPGMKMGAEAFSSSGARPTVAVPGDGAPRRRTTRSGRPC
jgi:hypothetical protein